MRGYAVCGLARSGSTFLCQLLASTGVLGRPREYFNVEAIRRDVTPDYPADPEGQLMAMSRLAATPNEVYGLKVLTNQFDAVLATRWATRLPALSFVYLERRDLLAQAISLIRAIQTKQWTSGHARLGEPAYDAAAINNLLVSFARDEARWRYYFARNGIEPLRLVYEDLMADPQGPVTAVAALMGVDPAPRVDVSGVSITIQRDGVNEAWRERYLAQHRDLGRFY
jgi:LPS sulfotransferase NodH